MNTLELKLRYAEYDLVAQYQDGTLTVQANYQGVMAQGLITRSTDRLDLHGTRLIACCYTGITDNLQWQPHIAVGLVGTNGNIIEQQHTTPYHPGTILSLSTVVAKYGVGVRFAPGVLHTPKRGHLTSIESMLQYHLITQWQELPESQLINKIDMLITSDTIISNKRIDTTEYIAETAANRLQTVIKQVWSLENR